MTVKEDLLEWIITNKNTMNDGEESYVTFRAGEAAGVIGTNINNVSKALGALKEEGVVVNPAHGFWAWTGEVPEEPQEAPKRRRASNGTNPKAKAAESVKGVLEGIETRRAKAVTRMKTLQQELANVTTEVEELEEQEKVIRAAYDALAVKE